MTDVDHQRHMRRALELAREAARQGNTPFGSLLVRDGEVIATDHNTTLTEDDITAHPELKLARWAARELPDGAATETTMYTSTMPCMMCSGAIAIAELGAVVYSVGAETAADLISRESGAPSTDYLRRSEPTDVIGPVLGEEGRQIHRDHWGED